MANKQRTSSKRDSESRRSFLLDNPKWLWRLASLTRQELSECIRVGGCGWLEEFIRVVRDAGLYSRTTAPMFLAYGMHGYAKRIVSEEVNYRIYKKPAYSQENVLSQVFFTNPELFNDLFVCRNQPLDIPSKLKSRLKAAVERFKISNITGVEVNEGGMFFLLRTHLDKLVELGYVPDTDESGVARLVSFQPRRGADSKTDKAKCPSCSARPEDDPIEPETQKGEDRGWRILEGDVDITDAEPPSAAAPRSDKCDDDVLNLLAAQYLWQAWCDHLRNAAYSPQTQYYLSYSHVQCHLLVCQWAPLLAKILAEIGERRLPAPSIDLASGHLFFRDCLIWDGEVSLRDGYDTEDLAKAWSEELEENLGYFSYTQYMDSWEKATYYDLSPEKRQLAARLIQELDSTLVRNNPSLFAKFLNKETIGLISESLKNTCLYLGVTEVNLSEKSCLELAKKLRSLVEKSTP